MPFLNKLLPIILIASIIGGISPWLFRTYSSSSSEMRDTHTLFAISQMINLLSELKDEALPRTSVNLIKSLKVSNIDWNSCRIDGERILDGWGQPINATYEDSTSIWTFRSSGSDFKFGTDDDIVGAMRRIREGEQTAPSNGDKPSN